MNGRSIAPPELPTFALGTDARVTIESADGGARDVTVVLPKADPREAKCEAANGGADERESPAPSSQVSDTSGLRSFQASMASASLGNWIAHWSRFKTAHV